MIGEILISILTTIIVIVMMWSRNYGYWKSKKIPYIPGSFPYGSSKDMIRKTDNLGYILNNLYKKYENAKIIGFYALWQPMLMVKDPELIKNVLVKDFSSFFDNGLEADEKNEPMVYWNPVGMKGAEEWKNLRNFHRPVYTANRIKAMSEKLWKTSGNFVKYLSNKKDELDILNLCRFYTIDTVAMCAYNVESDSFHDLNSPFNEAVSGQLFGASNNNSIMFAYCAPFIATIFGFKSIPKKAEEFFINLGKKCMKHRREEAIKHNDLIQNIIEADDKRKLEGKPGLSDAEIGAACLTFYADGAETAGLVLALTLYEIAANPDIQEKLRQEIFSNGHTIQDFDFDKLTSMEYLDMVTTEVLRLHPPFTFASRLCTQDVELGGIKIEKGTKIFVPILSIHLDKKHYPNPEKFDPERFSKERKNDINKYTFLAFGDGPRICIGMKMAQTEIKMGVVAILLHYKIYLGESMKGKTLTRDKDSYFLLNVKGEVKLRFEKL